MTRGWSIRKPRPPGRRRTRQRSGRSGHDVGDRRLAEEDRDLAEELAAAQPGALRAVDDDAASPSRMTWKPEPLRPWRRTRSPSPGDRLLERVDDPLELRVGEVGEQREPGDRVDHLVSVRPWSAWCQIRRSRGSRGAVDGPPSRGAAWPPEPPGGPMTLTQDRQDRAPVGAPPVRRCRRRPGWPRSPRAVEVDFPAGHVIARQGEIGTGFFVIVDGGARVIRDGETIAELGPGEFFGELSSSTAGRGSPRSSATGRRPAWPSPPGTSRRSSREQPRRRPRHPARAGRPAARPDRSGTATEPTPEDAAG